MKTLFQVPDGILFFPAVVAGHLAEQKHLTPSDVLVYAALYTRYVNYRQRVSSDEEAFVSTPGTIIASQIGVSAPAFRRGLDRLKAAGLIRLERTSPTTPYRIFVIDPDKERRKAWQKDS